MLWWIECLESKIYKCFEIRTLKQNSLEQPHLKNKNQVAEQLNYELVKAINHFHQNTIRLYGSWKIGNRNRFRKTQHFNFIHSADIYIYNRYIYYSKPNGCKDSTKITTTFRSDDIKVFRQNINSP